MKLTQRKREVKNTENNDSGVAIFSDVKGYKKQQIITTMNDF